MPTLRRNWDGAMTTDLVERAKAMGEKATAEHRFKEAEREHRAAENRARYPKFTAWLDELRQRFGVDESSLRVNRERLD